MNTVVETGRLRLRRLEEDDAPFIFELVNDPDWLRFIGDRNVHSLEDARGYIRKGPLASYQRHGYGLYLVELRETGQPLGMCGLIRRDTLDHPDLGFAFLPRFRGAGYAREAARATLDHARRSLSLGPLLAITSLHNERSIALLEKLGFVFEQIIRMPNDQEELRLFRSDPASL
jgi:RimJ/RimL family protein N-acetyltransferase